MRIPTLPLGAALAALPSIALAADEPRPATVFIDYDGGRLRGGNDSSRDEVSCLTSELDYPGFFGSPTLADQVTEQVRAILAPFAVRVVDERPPSHLPYTMVVVGGLPQALGLDAGVGGYACVIDCGDELSRETVLVFAEEVRDPIELAQTIVHEVAHSWGLDHVLASDLIMNGTTSGSMRTLSDGCTPLEDPEAASCVEQHALWCDEPGTQHSVAELMEVRGPSKPDITPPQVVILSPADGDRVVPGELVVVEVEVEDDQPDFGWRFAVPELSWSARSEGRTTLELRFPAGEHTIVVEALDQAGNEATAEVTLIVDDAPPPTPEDDEPMPDDTDPSDAAPADDESQEGGCRMGPTPSHASWLLALLLVRRRIRIRP